MFKNYLKTAIRNFQKNRLLFLINLGGLTIGIAAVLLIGMYIYNEMGYDGFQQNKASLYRAGFKFWQNGKLLGEGPEFTSPFGEDAMNELPEIKSFTRISSERTAYISNNEKTIKVDGIHHADTAFFKLFSYKLSQGNPSTALKEPYSIVLTNEIAKRLFGSSETALGKVVRLNNQTDYLVTGIANEPPVNSHLRFNALISFITLYKEPGNFMGWNGGEQYITYLQLKKGTTRESIEKKLSAFMWKHINEEYSKVGIKIDASLQPLEDIHLRYSDNSGKLRTNIYVFSIVAILILIISCVNYINLSTAQATTRFKEIGVRKVLGATRSQLIKQFLFESLLVTTFAFIIALAIMIFITPLYQQLAGKNLSSITLRTTPALFLLFIIIMIVGTIAGSYVAFYLSSFNAARIFKAELPQSARTIFRKGMIIAQFTISIGLMSCALVVSLQLNFSRNLNPGYDRDHILVLPLVGAKTQEAAALLKQELSQLPDIRQVSALSEIPCDGIANNGFIPEGTTKAMIIHQLDVDENFWRTFNITMVSGNAFSKDRPLLDDGYIINETLAKILEWQDPVGKIISRNGRHRVVGVVKDFHFASLHDKIEPLIITNKPWDDHFSYLAIKYQTGNTSSLIDHVKKNWRNTIPEAPFDYWFLDDTFNNIYKDEEHFQKIFLYFSFLSIILTLAGVFGLVLLSMKQKTKELGIRKVLGAGITDIVRLTVKDFIWLIILAVVIATPLTWYYMNSWLQDFAYRISVRWWMFALCGSLVLLITLSTISIQAIRAAVANPVKSIRTE